jgi:hypothetical protein
MNLGRAATAIVAAYIITGLIYLWRNLTEINPLRVQPYIHEYRTDGGASRLLLGVILWLLTSIINGEFGYLLLFAILAAIGLYLPN